MDNNHFGFRLKELRKEKGLSQKELADKINSVKSAISNYENDIRVPNDDTISKLANILGVDRTYLSGKTNFKNNLNLGLEIVDLFVKEGIIKEHESVDLKTRKKNFSISRELYKFN